MYLRKFFINPFAKKSGAYSFCILLYLKDYFVSFDPKNLVKKFLWNGVCVATIFLFLFLNSNGNNLILCKM